MLKPYRSTLEMDCMRKNTKIKSLKVGIVGSGIAGMSAAWLLSQNHDVTVFEKDDRIGGHTNTVDINGLGIDTGFIVYNVKNYPNLIALFKHLGVETHSTDMSFGVSIDQGDFEYSGGNLKGLFAQKSNFFRLRFWRMVKDILRFYREAPLVINVQRTANVTLGEYLLQNRYSLEFQNDHLLPMGAAIWSTPVDAMLEYPLRAFIQFCDNHGLLQISDRPEWRTVKGGSHEYVNKLIKPFQNKILTNHSVAQVWSDDNGAFIQDRDGNVSEFDHVVMACHADQSLRLLKLPTLLEQDLLSSFNYQDNKAVLHTDSNLMPKNKGAWSSWNYLSEKNGTQNDVCVTYWMNRLQNLNTEIDYFVTLNPKRMPNNGSILRSFIYQHPIFNTKSMSAQETLWNLQGIKRLWFCGSYFGSGFHEDGLQSGLAVAEKLGGARRPWLVKNESGRIKLPENGLTRNVKVAA
jgi:predicted NAD/FAD-binding protein